MNEKRHNSMTRAESSIEKNDRCIYLGKKMVFKEFIVHVHRQR